MHRKTTVVFFTTEFTYRRTDKGVKVALLFLFFHKRLCGPLANSLFHHQPSSKALPKIPLEAAYHKADEAIQEIIQLLKAVWCYTPCYNPCYKRNC